MVAGTTVAIRNRQTDRRVDRALLRQITLAAWRELAPERAAELCVHLVSEREITRLNEQFLQHSGPTDVITFSLAETTGGEEAIGGTRALSPQPVPPRGARVPAERRGRRGSSTRESLLRSSLSLALEAAAFQTLVGEIYLCVAVAVRQAGTFRTSWQSEVARYVVHGLLHLLGYDDLEPVQRRRMKRVENRMMRWLEEQFPLRQLAARST